METVVTYQMQVIGEPVSEKTPPGYYLLVDGNECHRNKPIVVTREEVQLVEDPFVRWPRCSDLVSKYRVLKFRPGDKITIQF